MFTGNDDTKVDRSMHVPICWRHKQQAVETPAATFPWRSTPSVACSLKEESKLILFLHASVTKPEAKDVQGSCPIMMGRGRVMRDNLWGKHFAKSRELVLLLNLLCPQRSSLPYYSTYYKENGLLL